MLINGTEPTSLIGGSQFERPHICVIQPFIPLAGAWLRSAIRGRTGYFRSGATDREIVRELNKPRRLVLCDPYQPYDLLEEVEWIANRVPSLELEFLQLEWTDSVTPRAWDESQFVLRGRNCRRFLLAEWRPLAAKWGRATIVADSPSTLPSSGLLAIVMTDRHPLRGPLLAGGQAIRLTSDAADLDARFATLAKRLTDTRAALVHCVVEPAAGVSDEVILRLAHLADSASAMFTSIEECPPV